MIFPRILIAGIGNIFLGDDAFGVETVHALKGRSLPEDVTVRDFGVHGHDLAFALGDGYDAVVLVDATPRGQTPGTLSLLELSLPAAGQEGAAGGGHSLDPVGVLQLAANFGAKVDHLFLIGCEPAVLESDDGTVELSAPVRAAVPRAVTMIETLITALVGPGTSGASSLFATAP